MRLTKNFRDQLLQDNEGYSTKTHSSGKNFSEDRVYKIEDGKLKIHASGKSSWADSRYSDDWTADDKETHRFLKNNIDSLTKR